jgi:hypothetical protein
LSSCAAAIKRISSPRSILQRIRCRMVSRFAEGFDTRNLKEAKALLEELA